VGGQRALAHGGQRLGIDDVVVVAGAQQFQKVEATLLIGAASTTLTPLVTVIRATSLRERNSPVTTSADSSKSPNLRTPHRDWPRRTSSSIFLRKLSGRMSAHTLSM